MTPSPRSTKRVVTALVAIAMFATLALSTAATHAQSSGPVPVAPANGKTVHRGVPFTFKVRAPGATGVFVKVSRSKKVGGDGTLLSSNLYFRSLGLHGSLWTRTVERYAALPEFFLNRPGRYYWQAYTVHCDDLESNDCNVEGPIRSFSVR